MKKLACFALAAGLITTTLFAAPAAAQNNPFGYGQFSDVTEVTIDDGHFLDYANYLVTEWKKQEEFAKSKGWISDYKIYANVHKRDHEPDLYLMVTYPALPDAAEQQRRDEAMRAFMQQNDTQMSAGSAGRAKFRHIGGTQMLQELVIK